MATFNTKTLTDVNNFYKFFYGDPLSFNGLYPNCVPSQPTLCGDDDIWTQYDFGLSRDILAKLVLQAENNVASALGTFVKPKWVREEIEIPANWFNPSQRGKPINQMIFTTKYSYIKRFGQQSLSKILDGVEITYQDDDNDSFFETALSIFTLPENSNLCDLKFYFHNTRHEIGKPNLISYDEDTREVILSFDIWLLVKPELYINRTFRKTDSAIDACDIDNFITEFDVWEDTVDTCKPSVEFIYDETHSCSTGCKENKQPGCAISVDACEGRFKVNPQSYDEDGCVIDGKYCGICSIPKKIVVYYQAGCHSNSCGIGDCDTECFCTELEWIVFKLAASYFPVANCDCPCFSNVLKAMQQETSLIIKTEERIYNYPSWVRNEAIFGTAVGQIEAALDLLRIQEKFCNFST